MESALAYLQSASNDLNTDLELQFESNLGKTLNRFEIFSKNNNTYELLFSKIQSTIKNLNDLIASTELKSNPCKKMAKRMKSKLYFFMKKLMNPYCKDSLTKNIIDDTVSELDMLLNTIPKTSFNNERHVNVLIIALKYKIRLLKNSIVILDDIIDDQIDYQNQKSNMFCQIF